MEQKDKNNRGREFKLKLKGGRNQLFIFIQKAFKRNNSFVDVGGILWTASFSSQSAHLAGHGTCLRCCIPAALRRWAAVEVAAILGKSCLRFQSKLV